MTYPFRTGISMFACMLICSTAMAQNQPAQQRPGQDNMARPSGAAGQADSFDQQLRQISQNPQNAADKLFVLGCAKSNLMGVEISRQAQQKAQNPQVKQLAQQIVQDHEQGKQQLEQLARQLNVQLPDQIGDQERQMIQILTSLPSDQFEKWYTAMTQAHHAQALIANRAVAHISQNDQVKQYAQRQVTMLARHYDQAQQAAMALGLPGGGPEAMPASGRLEGAQPGNQQSPQDRDGINPRTGNTQAPGTPGTPRP